MLSRKEKFLGWSLVALNLIFFVLNFVGGRIPYAIVSLMAALVLTFVLGYTR